MRDHGAIIGAELAFRHEPMPDPARFKRFRAQGDGFDVLADIYRGPSAHIHVTAPDRSPVFSLWLLGYPLTCGRLWVDGTTPAPCPTGLKEWGEKLMLAAARSRSMDFVFEDDHETKKRPPDYPQDALVGEPPMAGRGHIEAAGLAVGWFPGAKAPSSSFLSSPLVRKRLAEQGFTSAESEDGPMALP